MRLVFSLSATRVSRLLVILLTFGEPHKCSSDTFLQTSALQQLKLPCMQDSVKHRSLQVDPDRAVALNKRFSRYWGRHRCSMFRSIYGSRALSRNKHQSKTPLHSNAFLLYLVTCWL